MVTHALGRLIGSAAGGGWQNYGVVVDNMHLTRLFLSEFIEMINSLNSLLLGENSDCLGTR